MNYLTNHLEQTFDIVDLWFFFFLLMVMPNFWLLISKPFKVTVKDLVHEDFVLNLSSSIIC